MGQMLTTTPIDVNVPECQGDIRQIREAYDLEAGGDSWVPPSVRDVLTEEQRRRLVLLIFENSPMVCLLGAGTVEREQFVMCMKVLRLYAQSTVTVDTQR